MLYEGPGFGEVHLWTAKVDEPDPDLEEERDRSLPDALVQKGDQLFFPEDRRILLNSQFLLRGLLARYLDRPFSEIRLGRGAKGKPFSLDDPFFHFNMSHSGELCVIAFTRGGELGVDIEELRPLPDMERLIQDNFRPSEIRDLEREPVERRRSFFRFWTFKESYLKAIGEGMRLHPRKIEFRIDADGPVLSSAATLPEEDPLFVEFTPQKGYQGTLTLMGSKKRVRSVRVEPREFLVSPETLGT